MTKPTTEVNWLSDSVQSHSNSDFTVRGEDNDGIISKCPVIIFKSVLETTVVTKTDEIIKKDTTREEMELSYY